MTEPVHADLIKEIEDFCHRVGMAKSSFGLNAVKDPALVGDLENGRELRRATLERVREFMAVYNSGADQ